MSKRVSESAPVQVYLHIEAQRRLESLATQLGLSKSEVLRRGVLALERELLDPAAHPALRVIGLVEDDKTLAGEDPARDHDRELADAEEARWAKRAKVRRAPKRRGR